MGHFISIAIFLGLFLAFCQCKSVANDVETARETTHEIADGIAKDIAKDFMQHRNNRRKEDSPCNFFGSKLKQIMAKKFFNRSSALVFLDMLIP